MVSGAIAQARSTAEYTTTSPVTLTPTAASAHRFKDVLSSAPEAQKRLLRLSAHRRQPGCPPRRMDESPPTRG
jgi:hypothetical protein